MNKKLATIIPLVLLMSSTFAMPVLAAEPPQYGPETVTIVTYKEIEGTTEHKWDVVYNSNYYAVKVYSKGRRLMGWEVEKNKQTIVAERDFVSDPEVNPPLFGYKQIGYFDYCEYHVKEHRWNAVYDNDFYTLKIYTEAGNNILLGWQIFKNGQLISTRSFI